MTKKSKTLTVHLTTDVGDGFKHIATVQVPEKATVCEREPVIRYNGEYFTDAGINADLKTYTYRRTTFLDLGYKAVSAERFKIGDRVKVCRAYWSRQRAQEAASDDCDDKMLDWYDKFDLDKVVTVTGAIVRRGSRRQMYQSLTLDAFVHSKPLFSKLDEQVYDACWFESAIK